MGLPVCCGERRGTPHCPQCGKALFAGNRMVVREGGVWMMTYKRNQSAAREIAERAMSALGLDPNAFRQRDSLITAIAPTLEAMLDSVSGTDL